MSEVVSNGSNTILDAIRQESQKSRPAPGPVPFGATPHHSIRAWRGASPAIIIVAEPAIVIVAAHADLLRPIGTTPRYSDHGYEGDIELWQPRPVSVADKPDLERQLAVVDAALAPGDPGVVLARVHALLAMYRDREPLPPQVEAAIAECWLEDVGEYPDWVAAEAVRRWRRHPVKYRFKPLPGDIRLFCEEVAGRLVTMRERLRKLLATIPRTAALPGVPDRASDVRSRVLALASIKRMP